MIQRSRNLWLIPCLALFGTACAVQPVVDPGPCDVIIEEKLVELPAELLIPQPCPAVPDHGDVGHLLDWAENCAISARLANDQLGAIRELQE